MNPSPSTSSPVQYLTSLAHGDELARLVRDSLFEAVRTHTPDPAASATQRAAQAGLSHDDAETRLGNVIDALSAADDPKHAQLLSLLLARGLALDPPQGVDAEDQTAGELLWLAANLGVDAFGALDVTMGEKADGLWGAVADLVQRYDARGGQVSRAEALTAAASLGVSSNPTAMHRAADLSRTLRNPLLIKLLGTARSPSIAPGAPPLKGELSHAPHGALVTFLLAICGWLLLSRLARLLGRIALQYRRPAELELTDRGLLVRSRTQLMGKVLRQNETIIPIEGLARATREVRFPRVGLYAGLTALALGSYLGVSWFIDGVRAGSASLAAIGLLIVVLGIGLDFVLTSLLPGTRGRCRVLLIPRRGSATCLAFVDAKAADATLAAIAKR